MFQRRVRAFIDHQPGNVIPIEKITPILKVEDPNFEEVKTQSKLQKLRNYLDKLFSRRREREIRFDEECENESVSKWRKFHNSEATKSKEEFIRENEENLGNLLSKSKHFTDSKFFMTPQIQQLLSNVTVSYSEYKAFVEACRSTSFYAKENCYQVLYSTIMYVVLDEIHID